jgi:hypothetical protein
MVNAKVYLGKEKNEVALGLASDVVCTLVQRNVTTDNFLTSVVLANQLKNKKIDTCWDNEAKQKRNSTRVQAWQAT